jgi:acyl dehydratase
MRYWEDFEVGETTETGPIHVTEEEIIEFARKYDPQPFHVDPEAGKQTMYGGLIASGWHTAALYMGAFVRATLGRSASLGAPGVEVKWHAPVRPGDTLTGRAVITETRPSSKDPGRGTIFGTHEIFNQEGVKVMTLKTFAMIARRPT